MPPATLPATVAVPVAYLWVAVPLAVTGLMHIGFMLGDWADELIQRWWGQPEDAPRTWS